MKRIFSIACCSLVFICSSAVAQSLGECSLDDQALQYQCVQECNNMVATECQSVGVFVNADSAFAVVEERVSCQVPFRRFRRQVANEASKVRLGLRGLIFAGMMQRSVLQSFNAKVEAHIQACKQALRDNSSGGGDENPPPPPPGYGEARLR